MSSDSKIKTQSSKIEMNSYRLKKSDVQTIVAALNSGGIAILPTDTVYGIFCKASEKKAVDRIYKLKGRSFNKPLQVFFNNVSQMKKYADFDKTIVKTLDRKLPGKYTFILNLKKGIKFSFLKKTIGVRHIRYAFINEIIKKTGPLAATSVNISGSKSAVKFRGIPANILNKTDVSVSFDKMVSGKASKVVNLISGEVIRS